MVQNTFRTILKQSELLPISIEHHNSWIWVIFDEHHRAPQIMDLGYFRWGSSFVGKIAGLKTPQKVSQLVGQHIKGFSMYF